MDSNIKVLIVDDHKLISEAWSSLLKDAPNISVIGTADNVDDAYTMSMQYKPEIVLMDINLGEGSGFDATEKKKILKAWELDITLLQVCDQENMGSANSPRLLSRIHQAIYQIEAGL